MLPGVRAAVVLVVLQFAVADLVHALLQQAGLVALQQGVPLAPPDHLDHVPAGAAKDPFELLDNLAVAAHRPVQALQVTVDDKMQVAQLLPACQRDGAEGFGFIALTVAHETPDIAVAVLDQATALLVLHDVGLVDRLDGAQAHGDRRELPVVGHQPGVGIGRQAAPVHLPAKLVQLRLLQPALQERAGVHARRAVALVEHQVAGMAVGSAAEKMVEPHVVQGRTGGEAGNMAAEPLIVVVGTHHHGQGVPAYQGANAAFHKQVPRHHLFFLGRDGVGKGGGDGGR